MATSTEAKIRAIFANMSVQGQQTKFMDCVADDVDWRIMGHSPMSRKYAGKQDFVQGTLSILRDRVLTEPLRVRIAHILVGNDKGGDEINATAAVELEAIDSECRNGLTYDMRYCWICTFEKSKIVQVRAYLDTELLVRAMEENP